MPLSHLAAPVKKDRHRYPSDTQLFGYTVFPSDRKGQLEGFHEFTDVVIATQDEDTDKAYPFAVIVLIGLLKFWSLLLTLRSQMSADVYYHRNPACSPVCDRLSVNGL